MADGSSPKVWFRPTMGSAGTDGTPAAQGARVSIKNGVGTNARRRRARVPGGVDPMTGYSLYKPSRAVGRAPRA